MKRAEIVTAVLLGLLSVYLMWKSGEPPSWNPDAERFDNVGFVEGEGLGSGTWPFFLSGAMLICSIWIAINWFRKTSPFSRSEEPFMDGFALRSSLLVGGGLLGFLIAIEFVGFYAAIFLFLVYYLGALGRHGFMKTATISVVVPVVGFFFFDVAMRIILPKGYLEPLFVPLYAIFL